MTADVNASVAMMPARTRESQPLATAGSLENDMAVARIVHPTCADAGASFCVFVCGSVCTEICRRAVTK